jgi:hypothetical protein
MQLQEPHARMAGGGTAGGPSMLQAGPQQRLQRTQGKETRQRDGRQTYVSRPRVLQPLDPGQCPPEAPQQVEQNCQGEEGVEDQLGAGRDPIGEGPADHVLVTWAGQRLQAGRWWAGKQAGKQEGSLSTQMNPTPSSHHEPPEADHSPPEAQGNPCLLSCAMPGKQSIMQMHALE